jgi:hypothetical protein
MSLTAPTSNSYSVLERSQEHYCALKNITTEKKCCARQIRGKSVESCTHVGSPCGGHSLQGVRGASVHRCIVVSRVVCHRVSGVWVAIWDRI